MRCVWDINFFGTDKLISHPVAAMEDSHLVDFLLSPLKRVHNMTSELFQGSGLEELKTLKVQESLL